jgi:tetratricopeptide (TPR) repeat protein
MLKRVLATGCLLLFCGAVFAAKLKVQFYDDQGKPLGEAAAKVINNESKKEQVKKANKKGELVFDGLAAGEYVFIAQKQGFLERKLEGIKIENEDVPLDIKLISGEYMKKEESDGNAAFQQRDFKTALSHYENVLKYAPNSAIIWANIAKANALLADWEPALNAAQKAASLDPAQFQDMAKQLNMMSHYQIGEKALNDKKFNVAETELLKARELDPSNSDVMYALSLAYGHQKKYAEAIKICEEGIKLRPTDAAFTDLLKILKNNAAAK